MANKETPRLTLPEDSKAGWPRHEFFTDLVHPVYRDMLCPRCKQFHESIDFHILFSPSEDIRWYAICPDTNQPIFLRDNPALSDSAGLWICESDFLLRHRSGRLSTSLALAVIAILRIASTTLARWSRWWKNRTYKRMVRIASGSPTSGPGPCTQIG